MRTRAQKDADEFDRKLFALMDDARQRGDKDPQWRKISLLLQEARYSVRDYMHPYDQKLTQG